MIFDLLLPVSELWPEIQSSVLRVLQFSDGGASVVIRNEDLTDDSNGRRHEEQKISY